MLIDTIMYGLKRDWGQPISYRCIGTSSVDPDTGAVCETVQDLSIQSGVHIPMHIARSYASKLQTQLFAVSGDNDQNSSVVLIEKTDLPAGLHPKSSDMIQIGSQWYQIKAWNDLRVAYEFEVVLSEGVS